MSPVLSTSFTQVWILSPCFEFPIVLTARRAINLFSSISNTISLTMACATNDVVRMTDESIAECFHEDETGHLRPWVCMSCDGFVKKEKKRFIAATRLNNHQALFSPQRKSPNEVLSYYTYNGAGKQNFMKKMMLSPRACFTKDRFCICSYCESSVQRNEIPLRTIANGFEIGPCPKELLELNQIELSFISPMRAHGDVFTFFGGARGVNSWKKLAGFFPRS